MTFLPGQPPGLLSPRQLPLNNPPWTTTTRTFGPQTIAPEKLPLNNSPGQLPPMKSSQDIYPPEFSKQLPLIDSPWVTAPQVITPMKFSCISTMETLRNE